MPYEFEWHDAEHTIICIRISGEVTWQQWHSVVDEIIQELEARRDCRIDVILDDYVGMPQGNPIANMISTAEKLEKQPNLGLMVTVSHRNASRLVKAIIEMIGRAYAFRHDYYGGFVDTMDEALAVIARDRENRVIPPRPTAAS